MNLTKHRAIPTSIVALASVVTLAACGSSSTSASSTSAAPASSSAAAESSSAAPTEAASETPMASEEATTSAAAIPDIDACAILTSEEIAGIVGSDPGAGTTSKGACFYENDGLQILAGPAATYDGLVNLLASDPSATSNEPLEGVGDRAQYLTGADKAGTPQQAVVAANSSWTVGLIATAYDVNQLGDLANAMLTALG